MELFLVFAGAFVVALSGALIPGPMLTVTVIQSLRHGFRAGPEITAGHAAAEIGLLVLVILGLGPVITRPSVMKGIYSAGGVLLIISGVYMFTRRGLHVDLSPEGGKTAVSPFLSGVVTSVSNPTWHIWWATVGLAYVTKALSLGIPGIAAFFSGHILADLGWYGLVSFSVSRGGSFVTPKTYRTIISACSFLLAGFGFWFLLSAL